MTTVLQSVIPALICITLHELAHGYVAYKLGDSTAKNEGRLTLNPIKHIDITGLIMMLIFKFGWAKPVPVDMNNFKNPKRGMAVCALAGPAANIIIAAVCMVLFGTTYYLKLINGSVWGFVAETLQITAYLSIALAVFNLLPIPPLDGSKILFAVLPDSSYRKLMYVERYGMIFLIAFLFIVNRLGVNPLASVTKAIYDQFFNLAQVVFSMLASR
ncbi:MAG: site-2 protease family protein [Ruminococcaceae bacterium]|nr:site-2 protease family protein [Oscillospiraceae bacterium]